MQHTKITADIESNEIYLTFENHEDGLSVYFESHNEAEYCALASMLKTIKII